jgi:hypothetical protein
VKPTISTVPEGTAQRSNRAVDEVLPIDPTP